MNFYMNLKLFFVFFFCWCCTLKGLCGAAISIWLCKFLLIAAMTGKFTDHFWRDDYFERGTRSSILYLGSWFCWRSTVYYINTAVTTVNGNVYNRRRFFWIKYEVCALLQTQISSIVGVFCLFSFGTKAFTSKHN